MVPVGDRLPRRRFLAGSAGSAFALGNVPLFTPSNYGAVGDGKRLDTKPLQSAIDACARAGGGTVLLPAGRYLCGTLFLKSNVTLHLSAGCVLLGSPNLADYPTTIPGLRSYTDNYCEKCLIYGENLENITIEGAGIIDGQGKAFTGPYKVRPFLLRLAACRRVNVSGIAFKDSPMWVQHYLACENVAIHGISVHSRANANNDGIDIDGCDRVRISDCEISSGDDAIVLKSTFGRPAKNVVVNNCVLSTHCNALKLGTESNGGFESIVISNCTIYETRLAGIALESVDGGRLDRVQVANITMDGVGAPIFLRLGDRGRPYEKDGPRQPPGRLRNVIIRDVQAVRAGRIGCAMSGLPGHPIEDVALDNIRLEFEGGGKPLHARGEVPEYPDKYPEYSMFGALPAFGFYCRHVRGLHFRDVHLTAARPEERPALLTDDVEGMEISGSNL